MQSINPIKKRIFVSVVLLAAFIAMLAAFWPAPAKAADYGPWYPNPNSSGQQAGQLAYQADIQPFNSNNISEITNFGCVLPNGVPLNSNRQGWIADIIRSATMVYTGTLSADEFDSQVGSDDLPSNLGFPSGYQGMDQWLQDMHKMLTAGGPGKSGGTAYWVPDSNIQVGAPGAHSSSGIVGQNSHDVVDSFSSPDGKVWFSYDDANNDSVGQKSRQLIAQVLNLDARTPLQLTSNLPQGCTIQALAPPEGVSFGDLFSNFGDTVTNLIFYIPSSIASDAYEFIAPYAFKYTFWTPHTERGDTMFNTPDSCVPQSSGGTATPAQISDYCQSNGSRNVPLGFSKKNTQLKNQGSMYLNIAKLLQWLVSGVYFLVLFTAAVLYMFRGNRSTTMNVMHLIPRLLLSIILTMCSGFLIGALISFSNFLVQTMFQANGVKTVGAVNTFLLQAGTITGGGEFTQRLVQLVVGAATIWFFFLFIIGAVIRQLGLLVIVIIAPLAFFCLINDAWRPNFMKWMRALLVVCFTPAIMALVFKIGMSVNPLLTDPAGSYGTLTGGLGLILMLLTLWAMTRVLKLAKNFIIGSSGTATGMIQGAGAGAGALAGAGGAAAILPAMAGAALQNQAAAAGAAGQSKLIPGGRATSAGAMGSAGAGKMAPTPPRSSVGGAAVAALGYGSGESVKSGIKDWTARRKATNRAELGIRPITPEQYLDYEARAAAAERAGLDPEQVIGGKLLGGKNGEYFFQHTLPLNAQGQPLEPPPYDNSHTLEPAASDWNSNTLDPTRQADALPKPPAGKAYTASSEGKALLVPANLGSDEALAADRHRSAETRRLAEEQRVQKLNERARALDAAGVPLAGSAGNGPRPQAPAPGSGSDAHTHRVKMAQKMTDSINSERARRGQDPIAPKFVGVDPSEIERPAGPTAQQPGPKAPQPAPLKSPQKTAEEPYPSQVG